MKKKVKVGLVLVLSAGLLVGCFLTTPVTTVTPTPTQVVSQLPGGGTVTNTVVMMVTNTVYVPNTQAIAQVQTGINAAAPFVPAPYSAAVPIASQVLGWGLAIIAGWIANSQNKKAKAGKAIISAVETLPTIAIPSVESPGVVSSLQQVVKDHIASVTSAMGQGSAVDSLVQSTVSK